MSITKVAAPATQVDGSTNSGQKQPAVQVLRVGKPRIVGGTKFGKDGCGY